MSKGLYDQHFAQAPTDVKIGRSRFLRSQTNKTSFDAGKVIPFYIDEVLPGDTFDISTSIVARMSTMLKPVMDDCYLDYYYFFVPTRLIWDHWREFMGENTTTYWSQTTEYSVPQLKAILGSDNTEALSCPQLNSVWDYFGLPTSFTGENPLPSGSFSELSVSALPFRAYAKVWNDWFRDENNQTPISINTGDSDDNLPLARFGVVEKGDYVTDSSVGGCCAPVNRFHDYFTSCLPSPQKGQPVSVPLGLSAQVMTSDTALSIEQIKASQPVRFAYRFNGDPVSEGGSQTVVVNNGELGVFAVAPQSTNSDQIIPTNLYADLSNASGSTINQLREAFAIQRLLERDARGGTRYREILRSHFNVVSPDSTLQVSEYLGGQRIRINVQSVAQTSASTEDSPQGNLAGYSITSNNNGDFIKSFTEHGYVIGVLCVRTAQTYQQGINRMFSRKRRFDYYFPALANLGEQAVLNKELYAFDPSKGDETFGFQERWAEYRYLPSLVTGQLRSGTPFSGLNGSLDSWHYANMFDSLPVLNSSFIQETDVNVNRTLAVTSAVANQFIADIQVNNMTTRPMPLYSIPGLIDHN